MERLRHVVSIVVNGRQIDGWEDYDITSSMIQPSDSFSMRRPFDPEAWNELRVDSKVRIQIDGVSVLDGFVDRRKKRSKDHSIEIGGRDRAGRLVQESAPAVNYQGLEISEAIRRLASPWFGVVTLSDARNRKLRTGKGRKVPTGNEPIVVRRRSPNGGKVQPGQSRWSVIEEIVSQAGLIAWSSADGKEIVVGRPNYSQAPQFVVRVARPGSGAQTTCKELDYEEDCGDRYSMIAVVGSGGGTEADYGKNVTSRRGVVFDDPSNRLDGTGRDFLHPKRLLMPERNFDSNNDADEIAQREQARRDFRRVTVTATMPFHGQFVSTGAPTIFAPNTIASVIDEEMEPRLDDDYLIYQCTYRGSRSDGSTTMLEMVPSGTEIVL